MNIELLKVAALKKKKNGVLVEGFSNWIDDNREDLSHMDLSDLAKGLELACAELLTAKQFNLVIELALSEIENPQEPDER